MSPEIEQLLAIVDAAYDRHSWHGPNLRGSIRGVTPRVASWRPAPNRHNLYHAGQIQLLKRLALARR